MMCVLVRVGIVRRAVSSAFPPFLLGREGRGKPLPPPLASSCRDVAARYPVVAESGAKGRWRVKCFSPLDKVKGAAGSAGLVFFLGLLLDSGRGRGQGQAARGHSLLFIERGEGGGWSCGVWWAFGVEETPWHHMAHALLEERGIGGCLRRIKKEASGLLLALLHFQREGKACSGGGGGISLSKRRLGPWGCVFGLCPITGLHVPPDAEDTSIKTSAYVCDSPFLKLCAEHFFFASGFLGLRLCWGCFEGMASPARP